MKITAPISRIEEIEPLARAGADELYCGVVPREWVERFGTGATNRRIFGNLSSYDELRAAVDAAHAAGSALFMVMNAQHYAGEQLDALVELAGRFDALGGDALIVGDVTLLALLGRQGLRCGLHVSSVMSCRNTEAARVHRDLGASRIVLPRDVTLAEVERMARALPDLEFEAFVLNDGCVFEEGACHTLHLPSRLGGPICLDRYGGAVVRTDGRAPDEEAIAHNEARYKDWLWYRFGCGFSVTEEGYPYGPCGLCAMPAFQAAGVASVKVAGREAATARKIRSVEMVASVRDRLAGDPGDLMRYARGLRGGEDRCAPGYMCYYREVAGPRC